MIKGIAKGEEQAFKYLFDSYYQLLVTFAFRYVQDLDTARNIVQEVFVVLFEKRTEIHIHTSLKSHLYQSVRNRALNLIKREKMQREHHGRIMDERVETVEHYEDWMVDELENRIGVVVDKLPLQCRKIFRMSRRDGIPNADIAQELSISKRTVETQISKALRKIREDLLKNGYLSIFVFVSIKFKPGINHLLMKRA